eukprot:TRINITY_DN12426_c0_g1_i1.p2 TRINITY_DN12426_c0_g1~~TRINITY_DN12426_c0_g1_i1.p2  ORF type:complete len:156 (-),score=40.33 TRINITY_DN12426_c0_g1_i1:77-544(-)
MVRRPPRSTLSSSSAASDVYKRQVIKVVGKTFKKIVLDDSKDVLVKFFVPQADPNNEFSQLFEEVAERLKQSKNLVTVEYNLMENENDEVQIDDAMAIQLFQTHAKSEPVVLNEQMTVENIVQFVKNYATVAITDTPITKNEQILEENNTKKEEL